MFNVTLENSRGQKLEFNSPQSPFTITEMQGLGAPDALINTSSNSYLAGAKFNSSKAQMRTIDIKIKITSDPEANRIALYRVLKSGQYVKFNYKGKYRDVYIEGYVATMPINLFENIQNLTVSILCPSSYFKSAQEMINEMNSTVEMFHFPFAITEEEPQPFAYIEQVTISNIENDGDVETGMIIELYATEKVVNPKVFNYKTKEFIGVNFEMQAGDLIEISTSGGNKKITLLRDSEYSNIFNSRMKGSTWLTLQDGENIFTYEASNGLNNLRVVFKHYNLYEGI